MRRSPLVFACASTALASACSLLIDTSNLTGRSEGDASAPLAEAGDAPASDAPGCASGGDPSLILYLPLDEQDGTTAFDCSGRAHHGNLVGSLTGARIAGHKGRAVAFDGDGTCIGLGQHSDFVLSATAFTFATWARVDEYQIPVSNDARQLMAKSERPNDQGWRFISDDKPALFGFRWGTAGGNPFTAPSSSPQPVGTWLHVAGVMRPGDRVDIFVNGTLSNSTSSVPSIIEDTTASLFVGCRKPGYGHFKGALDEVRLYARALSADEIAALAK